MCSLQVGAFIAAADSIQATGARVILVYPGPAADLESHAAEFTKHFKIPANFTFVTDPDFKMITAYGLRWNAAAETAYPSTFVLDPDRTVLFSKISTTHGDRADVSDVLEVLRSQE